jgi:hypothetical protein
MATTHATEHSPARAGRLDTDRRASSTAARTIVVGALALALASLLNAESIRRTAQIQPEGWRRDVGLALSRALVSTSRALRFDLPREQLRRALGRPELGTDVTVTFRPPAPVVAKPHAEATTPAAGPSKPAPRPPKPAFSPEHQLRIWVAGDSLSVTPGWQLVRTGDRTHVIDAVAPVDGRLATGLERPDVFDWFRHVREQVSRRHPDAVVLTFGANDDHDLMTGVPGGRDVGGFGSRGWVREYRRRVGGLMDDVVARKAFLVWIGLPIARDAGESGRFRALNRIYRSEARKRAPAVAFVDTYSLFRDGSGGYSEYLARGDGKVVRMRSGDGVHYEEEGGQLIAWHVLRELNRVFDVRSWKRERAR